jgi:hypothetical protein
MQPEVVFLVLFVFALVITLVALFVRNRSQHMLHEERMAALEKGAAVPLALPSRPWSPRVYLLRGLIWSFSGVALFICLGVLAATSQRPESAESMAWNTRHLSDSLGIPIDQARQIVEKDQSEHSHGMPVTVALLGLIPFAVGLAYLVFYWTDPSRHLAAALTAVHDREGAVPR